MSRSYEYKKMIMAVILIFSSNPRGRQGGTQAWKNHRLMVLNAAALRLGLGIP